MRRYKRKRNVLEPGAGEREAVVAEQSELTRMNLVHIEHAPGSISCELSRRAMRFVHENLHAKLNWSDLAANIGMDAFTFGRQFKRSTGMTPHQFVIRCRLTRALELLSKTDRSLAVIALEVGCCSQSHLTALFRKHLDVTPGAYRLSTSNRRRTSIDG